MPYVINHRLYQMKKNYFLLFLIATSCFFLSCKSSKTTEATSTFFEGAWVGEAYQFDVDQDWSMRFNFNFPEKTYTVTYPSLNCGGKCKLIKSTPESLIFQEVIEYGKEACVNGGKIEIIKNEENKCTFFYYYDLKGDDPIAVGELVRSANYNEILKNNNTYNQ